MHCLTPASATAAKPPHAISHSTPGSSTTYQHSSPSSQHTSAPSYRRTTRIEGRQVPLSGTEAQEGDVRMNPSTFSVRVFRDWGRRGDIRSRARARSSRNCRLIFRGTYTHTSSSLTHQCTSNPSLHPLSSTPHPAATQTTSPLSSPSTADQTKRKKPSPHNYHVSSCHIEDCTYVPSLTLINYAHIV
jgi:hypothetical protein